MVRPRLSYFRNLHHYLQVPLSSAEFRKARKGRSSPAHRKAMRELGRKRRGKSPDQWKGLTSAQKKAKSQGLVGPGMKDENGFIGTGIRSKSATITQKEADRAIAVADNDRNNPNYSDNMVLTRNTKSGELMFAPVQRSWW